MNVKNHFIYARPTWLYTSVIIMLMLYLTLVPKPLPDTDLPLFPHADKLVHAIMFGGLVFAIEFDLMRQKPLATISKANMILIVIFATAFGGAIELAQGAMNIGRGADWLDFAADFIGAAVAAPISKLVLEKIVR